MNRFIDSWMRWFKHSCIVFFVDSFKRLDTNKSLNLSSTFLGEKVYLLSGIWGTKGKISLCKEGLKGIYKRKRKRINQCLLLLLTIAVISACNSTTTNQNQPRDSQTASSDCRRVQHELGEACVPANPQRVVVLGGGLDTVLSLGVKPIGSVEVDREDYSYLKNKKAGVASVGNFDSPNLESIAALKPDLILGTQEDKKSYEILSRIAPTVLPELRFDDDWKKLLNRYAEALGKTDKAKQLQANYDARIKKFQAQMGDRLQQTEVSIVGVFPFRILIYLEESYCGGVVADAGLPRPSHQTEIEETFNARISKELFHKADGDIIFVWAGGVDKEMAQESQTALKELKADPLWSQLNAVQQGKVYDVPSYWISPGPIAANLVLDDLFKYLIKTEALANPPTS